MSLLEGNVLEGCSGLNIPGRQNIVLECGWELPNDISMLAIPSRIFCDARKSISVRILEMTIRCLRYFGKSGMAAAMAGSR